MTPEDTILLDPMVHEDNRTDWQRYYDLGTTVLSFGNGAGIYEGMIRDLGRQNPELLDAKIPRVVLLGGFHPFNGTTEDFLAFWKRLHPNPEDTLYYLDMNEQPLQHVPNDPLVVPFLGKLENINFPQEKLDYVFLDYTVGFMTDEQITRLSGLLAQQLSKNGLVMVLKSFPERTRLAQDTRPFLGLKARSLQKVLDCFSDLKPVSFATIYSDGRNFMALAKKDSAYRERVPDYGTLRERFTS